MKEDTEKYYFRNERLFRKWSQWYDIAVFPFSGVRDKVVGVVDAERGSRILDVATGTGKQAFAFARKGYDVVGIDISKDMMEVAKKNNMHKVEFQVADAARMPYQDGCFDVSCISYGLHEMPYSIREKVIEEVARVTKLEGIVAIVDHAPNSNRIIRYLQHSVVKHWESIYYPEFIKSDLEGLLKKHDIAIKASIPILGGCGVILLGINKYSAGYASTS